MKKNIILIILVLCVMFTTISCLRIITGNSSSISDLSPTAISISTTTSGLTLTPANSTVTPTEFIPHDIMAEGMDITLADSGIESISTSYFYWSPKADYIVFLGYERDPANSIIANAYLYKLKDKKLIKLASGVKDQIYYLNEPGWAEDESMFTIPFYQLENKAVPIYLYYTNQEKLEKLEVSGWNPSISPDNNKLVYSNKNKNLCVFDLIDKSEKVLSKTVTGISPIWFSDNNRVLFLKYTGQNPSKLEGAEYKDISIIDTSNAIKIESLGFESTNQRISWILKDDLVWLESGYDDGHYVKVLDLNPRMVTDFGELPDKSYISKENTISFIVYKNDTGYRLLDQNMNETGVFATSSTQKQAPGPALSVISGDKLIYFLNNPSNTDGALMLSYLNQNKFIQLSVFSGRLYPFASRDGSKIALVGDSSAKIKLIDLG
ncbi:MAG: hypothetical protein ACYCYI_12875 [Saccharofermentanales bacterium]